MKAHQRLFWLLIFLLPVQLGRHFWPEWAYVLGLRVDYLAPTGFLTDILVVIILALWGIERLFKRKTTIQNLKLLFPASVFLFLWVNVLFAQNQPAALYKFVKIVEFTLLGFYVAKERYTLSAIRYPLSGAVIYSSLITLAQFIQQSSLGGPLWWLGERSFNAFSPGIAKAVFSGRLIMRPYATFPHPNVLAGFILVSLILVSVSGQASGVRRFFHWMAVVLGAIAIAISFSRSTWLVGLLVLPFIIYSLSPKKKIIIPAILVILLCVIGVLFFAPQFSTEEAISQRLQLIKVAINMIKERSLIGVGLNNFIPQLPNYWQNLGFTYWLQPVHNIFLLIAAETGILGLGLFLWFLILTFKKLLIKLTIINYQLLIALSAILILGLFDHYWLTLQQSQLLFAIVLGLSWAKKR